MFNEKSFTSFKNELPTKEIALTTEAYPMIDKEKLETELKMFYCRLDMHEYCKLIWATEIYFGKKLDGVLRKITKLIKIFLTILMKERYFPILKTIKTFIRNTECWKTKCTCSASNGEKFPQMSFKVQGENSYWLS